MLACALAAIGAAAVAPAAHAARRVYASPGYHWNHKLPKVTPTVPGRVIKLGDGAYPHVLVDAAGTGQIAYTTVPEQAPSVLRDCVLMRGQTGCAANAGLVPPTAHPAFSTDDDGPFPLAVGNELLMVDHRYPDDQTLPDGSSGYPTFLWTSEDGGRTFTGPGVIGNLAVSGNAIVWGGLNPHIAWITDTMTGGTFLQSAPAGQYTSPRLNLGDSGPEQAVDGRLALDGTLPVAEFQDLSSHIFIREYNGTGDIYDSASWSRAQINGQGYSQLVGGRSGVWLLYESSAGTLLVQRIVHGVPSGASHRVLGKSQFSHAGYTITEDASGRLTVGFVVSAVKPEIAVSSSSDGRHWSDPQVIARNLDDPGRLSIGAAADGGGFVAFSEPEPNGISRAQVDVAAFGTFLATGQSGLGSLPGDGAGGPGGDPIASASCTDVHFADIDAIPQSGCFLRDPKNPTSGAAVTAGEIRLNGLQIIPDAGVQIAIDPRLHTINTTGAVRVTLRAPGIGDITLYHGELHADLRGSLATAGQTLFDFDVSQATSTLEGFPFDGSIAIEIQHDSVRIPVSLTLPPYMGGVTGEATLVADNSHGLTLSSLHVGVDDLPLGALEIQNLSIDYSDEGDVWKGSAHLNIPAGTPYFDIDASVEFDGGDFTMGSFHVGLPFPGVPIFTDAYLNGFGGGFDIRPGRKRFFGSIDVGAIPLDPPNYAIGVTGTVSITFLDNGPVILEVDGSGSVHGLRIATAKLVFQTNGYFEVDGGLDLDLDVVRFQAALNAFVDLPAGTFAAELSGALSVGSYDIAGSDGIISSRGIGACGKYLVLEVGFTYAWGGSIDPMFESCDFGPLRVAPVSAASASARAHAAVASFPVAGGTAVTNVSVVGSGGVPSVVLTDPSGHTIVPEPLGPSTVHAGALVAAFARTDTAVVALRSPRAGTWRVAAAPGSVAITSVASARGYPAPVIRAHVTGRGRRRALHYDVTGRPGLSVAFAEQSRRVYKVIGTARGTRGTLPFVPSQGPGGRRSIYAILTQSGRPLARLKAATFTAPGPARPARVRGLRVGTAGRAFHVSFAATGGAAHYVVRLRGSDGRRLTRVISGGRRHLTVPALGYADHLAVTVVGVSSYGLPGPAATAAAGYESAVYRRAHAPRRHRTGKRRG